MTEFLLASLSAFWLGILTSISPCPLATNIAAISFVGRRVGSPFKVLLGGILYTLGRMATYLVIGVFLVSSLLSASALSHALLKYMNLALGPILILVGMFLVELIRFTPSGSGISESMQRRVESLGTGGAFLLGILFALTFCPVSAALFFGSLIPIALRFDSGVLLPSVYGIATGLPVFIFAFLIAISANWIGKAYQSISAFERWARKVTGVVFIAIGVYYSLTNIFGLSLL